MTGTFLNFAAGRRLPVILQTEAAECGLACVAMIASYYGNQIDLNTLRQRYPVSLKGATLRGLIEVANHLHLASRPLRFEIGHLRQLRLPAIVHWNMSHFVVLKSVSKTGIAVHDPSLGERSLSIPDASKHLTGVALDVDGGLGSSRQYHREGGEVRLRHCRGSKSGSTAALAQSG